MIKRGIGYLLLASLLVVSTTFLWQSLVCATWLKIILCSVFALSLVFSFWCAWLLCITGQIIGGIGEGSVKFAEWYGFDTSDSQERRR